MSDGDRTREIARILLAGMRLFNGFLALLAPGFLARRIGVDPDANPGILYVFRMFGVRTVLIGADLLLQKGERRSESLRSAVLIHASDTVAAYLAASKGQFPRSGRAIVLISAFNTALALVARRR